VLAIELFKRIGIPGSTPRGQFEVGGSHVCVIRRKSMGLALLRRNVSCLPNQLGGHLDA
jgi:hypothetical protein